MDIDTVSKIVETISERMLELSDILQGYKKEYAQHMAKNQETNMLGYVTEQNIRLKQFYEDNIKSLEGQLGVLRHDLDYYKSFIPEPLI